MKLGACVPITQYQTLVDCGYQSIALAAKDVALWSEAELSHAGKLLAHGPLEHINLNSFCPASLRLHGAGYSHDAVLQFTRTVLERGNRLGFRSASYDELAKKIRPRKAALRLQHRGRRRNLLHPEPRPETLDQP